MRHDTEGVPGVNVTAVLSARRRCVYEVSHVLFDTSRHIVATRLSLCIMKNIAQRVIACNGEGAGCKPCMQNVHDSDVPAISVALCTFMCAGGRGWAYRNPIALPFPGHKQSARLRVGGERQRDTYYYNILKNLML